MPGLGADHIQVWTDITGPVWTTRFFVDFVNFEKFNNIACGKDRVTTLVNTATLKPSDAALITSNPVVITHTRGPCS
jgi:hypothetical protein